MNEADGKRRPILRWPVGTKLIIAFLALALIPMSLTAYYNLTESQSAVAKVTRENLTELSRSTAHRIEGALVENQRTSATLAGEPLVAQFLAASEGERKGLAPQVYQTLQNFADTHPDYDAPGLLDVNGIVVASLADVLVGKDRSFRDYFQASIQGAPYISDMLVGRATGRPGVFLTNPVVTAEGEIVGIDIVWLKGDTIWSIIDDVSVGNEGISYLIDQDGVIIAHPKRDLLYHSLGELAPEAVATISSTIRFGTVEGTDAPLIPTSLGMDDLAAELALAQASGTYRFYSPLDGRDHVVGYTRLEAHPWTVLVDLPEAQFLVPLQRLGAVAWASVGLMGVIALVIAFLLVQTITSPIRRLTDVAIAVEHGRPFNPADLEDVTSGRDEIAHLGRVLASMVLTLRQELAERKRAEEALRESETRFRMLVENVPAITYTAALDESSTTLYVSPQIERMLGISPGEYKADPDFWAAHLHDEDRERVLEEVTRAHEAGHPFASEYRMISTDGRIVWLRDGGVIVRDEKGNPICLQGMMFDITERKRLEEQLRQAHKMEAVGRLAGGIAHDFNNLLTVINGYSQIMLASLAEKDPMYHDMQEILGAGRRAAELTQRMLAFSRRQRVEISDISLNDVVNSAVTMLHRVIKENIALEIRQASGLGLVTGDPGQLEQVVMNLAINARDAMTDGGTLTIETSNVDLDADYVATRPEIGPGRYVMLAVGDTGIGMDDEIKSHIFEPFFTTKEVDEGTGLGLAVVYGIVKQFEGSIDVTSEPGCGTTFRIYLPHVVREPAVASPESQESAPPRGTETILVVEDEQRVRNVTVRILRGLGYNVLEASNGVEALDLCEKTGEPIALMLIDLIMPQMSGYELVKQAQRVRQDFRVLYVSGYPDAVIKHPDKLEPGTRLMRKPFTVEQLAKQVREVLDNDEG